MSYRLPESYQSIVAQYFTLCLDATIFMILPAISLRVHSRDMRSYLFGLYPSHILRHRAFPANAAFIPIQLFSTKFMSLVTSYDHSFITSSALLRDWKLTMAFGLSILAYTEPSTTSLLRTSSTSLTERSSNDVSRSRVTRV